MRALTVKSKIRRHFANTPPNTMVATRQLLIHGNRASVDKVLQHLVKTHYIHRLARGVFIRFMGNRVWPTLEEIAAFKAEAFGRDKRKHGNDTAAKLKLKNQANEAPTYYIDGGHSSFSSIHGRIYFKRVSKKRMFMQDSPAGLGIRALWTLGEDCLDEIHIRKASVMWESSRIELEKVLLSKAWMPAWLGDCFQTNRYLGPEPALKP
ncbi:MAG: hypothetical protein JSS83_12485 [Cyanobacteria bacterium SZAS LIN-3]|nr:hypothetical protein [Cyanobacteria bacterium SZAS LIN-3]MBS2009163.1 hypothetical protein [Cyanobacteria bacterium SZAS TMP-1]